MCVKVLSNRRVLKVPSNILVFYTVGYTRSCFSSYGNNTSKLCVGSITHLTKLKKNVWLPEEQVAQVY